jgi:hypothetical protein
MTADAINSSKRLTYTKIELRTVVTDRHIS